MAGVEAAARALRVTGAGLAPDARGRVGVDALPRYPDRIDVRSPDEFALDHVPGARNHPVLSNAERARVGTLHARASAFEARKAGAALISRNIATIVEQFVDRPREWAPLVYCWRGGQRSRALAHVMSEVGWRAVQLEGGYRAWRRHVVSALQQIPSRFDYRVICGLTGSGKSRLIAALHAEGAQVLDLEALARHRGSLLGEVPEDPQPTQKAFESGLLDALTRLDPARPIFVESESRRIGRVQLPDALLDAMRGSRCVRLEAPTALRIALLKDEYRHFLLDPESLSSRLAPLVPLLGRSMIERWTGMARAGDFDALVRDLLSAHYDPRYARSIRRNFPRYDDAIVAQVEGSEPDHFSAVARRLISVIGDTARDGTAP